MSAVAGLVQFSSEPNTSTDLLCMLDAMAPFRRVDARGAWSEGGTGLGHLLTRQTPEDALEHQPLRSADGRFVLSGDLRLDNRAQLAGELGLSPVQLPTVSDGALVLAAWQAWREACPARLLGDFAFAVWDTVERRLFCARDPLGVRPLYYAQSAHRIAVASAMKGLLVLDDVCRTLDEEALADYLLALDGDATRTFYTGIRRLPSGHTLAVDGDGRLALRRYWAPDPEAELRLGSDDEYAERLRELLREAVSCRMRGCPGSGVLLSGGLDSSMLACLAADHAATHGHRLVAVASVLAEDHSGPETDEWSHIHAVVRSRSNIDVLRVTAPGAGLLTGLDEALSINDEPFRDPFHYMTRALLSAARDAGANNLFWGFGGDHVVSSWAAGYLAELFRGGHLLTLWRELKLRERQLGMPVLQQVRGRILAPLLPAALMRAWRQRHDGGLETYLRRSAIDLQFANSTEVRARLRHAVELWSEPRSVREGDIRAITARSLGDGLEYAAQLGDSLGVRLHTPMIDKRVIEFALAMPASQKAGGGWTRLAIRRAMAGSVPSSVCWRRDKGPFSPDFDRRLRRDSAELLAVIDHLEHDDRRRPMLDADRMRRVISASANGASAREREAKALLTLGAGVVAARFLATAADRVPTA